MTAVTTTALAGLGVAAGTSAQAVLPVPGPSLGEVTFAAADDPAHPWVLVNKTHPITPRDWAPQRLVRPDVAALGAHDRLRPVAARALEQLAAASERATGHELVLVSGYRSAAYQGDLYDRYVASHGRREADTFSARSGHSEHQTGLAADVTEAGTPFTRFGGTESGRWVREHAWRYGFVVRYPAGERAVTGYAPEPWHLRYVGVGLASHLRLSDATTLEEALGTGPAPDYPADDAGPDGSEGPEKADRSAR
ncbi:M15 family metallopeptidase [Isoptericola sp. BMS4]|uniref:M15 family metallopeptidase n=1 Tax=Isoptericola sp. BMS4 TaxID=2527875 RepID=UPI0014228C3C|nr:M15 family metallopeptidase [Isoptericola sp. BMS4]